MLNFEAEQVILESLARVYVSMSTIRPQARLEALNLITTFSTT
jgi:hypothetical protein